MGAEDALERSRRMAKQYCRERERRHQAETRVTELEARCRYLEERCRQEEERRRWAEESRRRAEERATTLGTELRSLAELGLTRLGRTFGILAAVQGGTVDDLVPSPLVFPVRSQERPPVGVVEGRVGP